MVTYTVTLSGPERDDGEKPFDYVVNAESLGSAVDMAFERHLDCICYSEEVFDPDCIWVERCRSGVHANGYFNDMRKETK